MIAAGISLLALAPLQAAAAPAATLELELVNALLYDGGGFTPGSLLVAGGRIVEGPPGPGARRLDLDGRYVLPALADAHTHRFAGAGDAESARELYLARGFIAVANLCGPAAARAETAPWTGGETGLDVLFTNGAITARGAHPVPLYRGMHERRGRPPETFLAENEGDVFYQVESRASLGAKLEQLLATGPDLVKFMLSPSLDPALVPPLVERAHAAGRRVVCHLDTAAQFRVALDAGVELLAHTPGYGVRAGEDLAAHRLAQTDARRAAAADLVVITTAGAYEHRADNSPARAVLGHNLALLKAAGVRIAFGSDDWSGPATELRALRALGVFTDAELVEMLCVTTPRALYPARDLGSLTPGHEANLAVYAEDPLFDLDRLFSPESVLKRGRVLHGTLPE